jgi:manganese/zinc/iron transport system ATP- binding protein
MINAIEIKNLNFQYADKNVLENINVYIPTGKLCGIVGSNGSGKTTLLKCILELLKTKNAHITFFEKPLSKIRQKIAYIPQRNSIDWDFPATVKDVILMGRVNPTNIFQRPSKIDKEIVIKILNQIQLEEFADRQISQLSGGQQQRTFLGRALAQQADLYLLDEPFAGIDKASEESIMSILKQLQKEGKTIVIVHHDLNTIKEYFDWLILLKNEIVDFGETELVFNNDNLQKTYQGHLPILI